MSAKRTLLIGTFVFEQTAPALAARGHPRLTKAGNISRIRICDRNYEMWRASSLDVYRYRVLLTDGGSILRFRVGA